jgi:hypothetical protein
MILYVSKPRPVKIESGHDQRLKPVMGFELGAFHPDDRRASERIGNDFGAASPTQLCETFPTSSSIVMTLPSGRGVVSVMAASFLLSWLRLATSSSARFGAASPTQLCETFPTSSLSLIGSRKYL